MIHRNPILKLLTLVAFVLVSPQVGNANDITGSITTVQDVNGKKTSVPLEGVWVYAEDLNGNRLTKTTSDVKGEYTLTIDPPQSPIRLRFRKPLYKSYFDGEKVDLTGPKVTVLPVALYPAGTDVAFIDFTPILQQRADSAPKGIQQIGQDINTLSKSKQLNEDTIAAATTQILLKWTAPEPNPKEKLNADFKVLRQLNVKEEFINDVRAQTFDAVDKSTELHLSPNASDQPKTFESPASPASDSR